MYSQATLTALNRLMAGYHNPTLDQIRSNMNRQITEGKSFQLTKRQTIEILKCYFGNYQINRTDPLIKKFIESNIREEHFCIFGWGNGHNWRLPSGKVI